MELLFFLFLCFSVLLDVIFTLPLVPFPLRRLSSCRRLFEQHPARVAAAPPLLLPTRDIHRFVALARHSIFFLALIPDAVFSLQRWSIHHSILRTTLSSTRIRGIPRVFQLLHPFSCTKRPAFSIVSRRSIRILTRIRYRRTLCQRCNIFSGQVFFWCNTFARSWLLNLAASFGIHETFWLSQGGQPLSSTSSVHIRRRSGTTVGHCFVATERRSVGCFFDFVAIYGVPRR